MNKKMLKLIGNPIGWMYVILVVALLVIISNNSSKIKDLQAEVIATEQLRQSTVDAMKGEISVREDAYETAISEVAMLDKMLEKMKNEIVDLDGEVAAINAKLNESDALRGDQELDIEELNLTVSDLRQELNDTKTLLDVCSASQTQ
tara:strand:- start:388 stop:828 length:441 start_codon:yes stop_codon:yes gene_type:complete